MRESNDLTHALAGRLRELRKERGWSLDALAGRSGVSRATLGRIETGQVSPTAEALNGICSVFGLTLSRLLASVEPPAEPLIRRADQVVYVDPKSGFERRSVSPPAPWFSFEMIEGRIPAGGVVQYDRATRPGIEHQLHLLEGALTITFGGKAHSLAAGDTLRWKLYGGSRYESLGPDPARYLLAMA